jgi:hypothetical protein
VYFARLFSHGIFIIIECGQKHVKDNIVNSSALLNVSYYDEDKIYITRFEYTMFFRTFPSQKGDSVNLFPKQSFHDRQLMRRPLPTTCADQPEPRMTRAARKPRSRPDDEEYTFPRQRRPTVPDVTPTSIPAGGGTSSAVRNSSVRDLETIDRNPAELSSKRQRTPTAAYTDQGAQTRRPKQAQPPPLLPQVGSDPDRSARTKNDSLYKRTIDRRSNNSARSDQRQIFKDALIGRVVKLGDALFLDKSQLDRKEDAFLAYASEFSSSGIMLDGYSAAATAARVCDKTAATWVKDYLRNEDSARDEDTWRYLV